MVICNASAPPARETNSGFGGKGRRENASANLGDFGALVSDPQASRSATAARRHDLIWGIERESSLPAALPQAGAALMFRKPHRHPATIISDAPEGVRLMAGHSKWKQIKRKKAITDAKRASSWTKVIREITVAARSGGGDPGGNPRLRTAIDAAKAVNMPGENIDRGIKKGTGELEGSVYEELTYEGYGPGGAAIFIEATTDNPNRTVAEIRHAFSRNGGNLGASNSVGWMFDRKGQIYLDSARQDEDP